MNQNEQLFNDSQSVSPASVRHIYVNNANGNNIFTAENGLSPDRPFATLTYAITWLNTYTGPAATYMRDISNPWVIELLDEQPMVDMLTGNHIIPEHVTLIRSNRQYTPFRNCILSKPNFSGSVVTSLYDAINLTGLTYASFADGVDSKGYKDIVLPLVTGRGWTQFYEAIPVGQTRYVFVKWDRSIITNMFAFEFKTTPLGYYETTPALPMTETYAYIRDIGHCIDQSGNKTHVIQVAEVTRSSTYPAAASWTIFPARYTMSHQSRSEQLAIADNVTLQDVTKGSGIKTTHIQNEAIVVNHLSTEMKTYLNDMEIRARNYAFLGGQ